MTTAYLTAVNYFNYVVVDSVPIASYTFPCRAHVQHTSVVSLVKAVSGRLLFDKMETCALHLSCNSLTQANKQPVKSG